MNSPEVVLICTSDTRRRSIATAVQQCQGQIVRELVSFPSADELTALAGKGCDAIVIAVDSDVAGALNIVEQLSATSTATVMVFSESDDHDLLVRCMRAGAREFLRERDLPTTLTGALTRAAARRIEVGNRKKRKGALLVFWGAKGGVGATTLASTFAITLRQEAGEDVALVDLNLQLGSLPVLLGITPQFTFLDALRNSERLDREFVSTLLTRDSTGLAVLPSADEYVPGVSIENGTVAKLLKIMREQYAYVVVDAGPAIGHSSEAVFDAADTIYVITQLDIPSLRNAQRFIAHRQSKRAGNGTVQVVLNRFEPRKLEYDEARITKAIGISPRWKVPNDYPNIRRFQNTGSPLSLKGTPVAKSVSLMARAACGKPVGSEKKSKLGIFGL